MMQALAVGIQGLALAWLAVMAWLALRTIRRALEARRARLEYWRRLLRSTRSSLDTLGPIRWHDGPDDHYLAEPEGGGAWVHHD